jgi:hypothetical protein
VATSSVAERPAETVLCATAGAVLGGAVGAAVGIGVPLAIVGGLNGAVSGARGIYDWRSGRGVAAFVLDSTWSIGNTAAGLAAHALGRFRGRPGYVPELSHRRNRHVYERGFRLRKGFAVTLGNVVNGAGDTTRARRAKLVTDHEDVHVWQARWFGPAFPVLYVGWMAGGALAGVGVWAAGHRDQPIGRVVESCAYYLNPFEWWAYSRDDHWPPSNKLDGLGWRRPAVRPFASFR